MPKKKRLLRPARVFDHHGTVPPGPTKDVLLQGLEDAGTSFEPGELAYLAVTSKVELPVRDRFAWELHRRLEDRSLLVAREWRRADLAVVRDGDAVVIIEGTALYAFDLLREPGLHKYRAKVTGDLAKAAALAPHADAYALVLCTHVLGEIAPQLKRWVVKYSSGIIGAAKSHGDAGQEAARQSLRGELNQLGPSDYRQMPSGSVWGLDVGVDAWLVGPSAVLGWSRKQGTIQVRGAQSAMAVINERLPSSQRADRSLRPGARTLRSRHIVLVQIAGNTRSCPPCATLGRRSDSAKLLPTARVMTEPAP